MITATEDKKEKTVLDLFPPHLQKKLFPVGRLDKDTVGLLLLTDDGELAHRLLSPKKQVAKVYEALVDGRMDETDQLAFQKGLDIGDEKPALPAVLKILKKGERSLGGNHRDRGAVSPGEAHVPGSGKACTCVKKDFHGNAASR